MGLIDREKVIRGLISCMIPGTGGCRDCPYSENGLCEQSMAEDAISLLKAQAPRVMTREEMEAVEPGTVIWCEHKDDVRGYTMPMMKYEDGAFENRYMGVTPNAANTLGMRFWSAKPTEEQRKEAQWDE